MNSRAMRLMVIFSLLILFGSALIDAKTFLNCRDNGNSRPSSRYRANVRTVIKRMGRFTIRQPDLAYRTYETDPDVFAMAFCSIDNKPKCAACLRAVLRDITKCGNKFGATATRVGCKARFDYFQFF